MHWIQRENGAVATSRSKDGRSKDNHENVNWIGHTQHEVQSKHSNCNIATSKPIKVCKTENNAFRKYKDTHTHI